MAGLCMTACNKQPSPVVNRGAAQNGAPTQTPPIAALPLATAAAPAAAPAPPANALAAPTQRVSFSPAPQSERYRYLDDADSMGGAFSDTPPDYAVDYQGTRPWIWRARNGAYRIVERLPRGERYYYYRAGQDQPFLVRDPDYSYAYNGARLVGVYGPGGAPLDPRMAAERSDYASRYFDRSRELYRAAQDQRRQAAYASEWAQRRDDLRNERQAWQEQQMRDREWRAWHDAHQSQEAQEWGQERDQRLAYAQAIGIPPGSSGPPPNPDEIARRQAAYFAARNARQQQTPIPAGGPSKAAPSTVAENHQRVAPPIVKSPAISQAQHGQSASPAPQPKTTDLAQLQQAAAAAKQKEATAAQAKAAEAAQAQKAAADQKNSEAAKAQASAAQAAQARKAAEEAKQKEAAAAKAKSANTAEAQKAAAEAKQKEAAASQAKAVQAA
ncbi:MAG TPA: hypothetical protein VGU01_03980, partial [Sphingomicrobium sp.]|nr:hypothetical protein [Sphingomicrobium sp.]